MKENRVILDVQNLSVKFKRYDKGFNQKDLEVISDLNVTVKEGEILAIAGSSGSGKSLLAHAILGILPKNASVSGKMFYYDKLLDAKYQNRLRGKEIALVPQSVEYLDPLMKVGSQVMGTSNSKEEMREVFRRYDLSEAVEEMYPFQLSGGMARRVLIATAVIGDSKLIIADEPTPGLSYKMAAETMQHFRDLADEGRGVILITHDIDLAFHVADKVAVFYAGTTVEIASAADFLSGESALRHPYSKALWRALPQNGFKIASGTQPYAGTITSGCLYAPRCIYRTDACNGGKIGMRELREGEVCCVNAT